MERASLLGRLQKRRPSASMIVAMTALVVALSGTAVAAGVLITSSKQIGNGVIVSSNIHGGTITGGNIHGATITGGKLANGTVGKGKLTSDVVSALNSSGGGGSNALEWFRKNGPENQPVGATQRIITADNIPAGVYAIFAKTIVTDLDAPQIPLLTVGQTADAQCILSAGVDIDTGRVLIGSGFGSGPGDVSAQLTHGFSGPGTVTLDCNAGSHWRASDSTLMLVKLSGATRTVATG
jgi:hypothetical protein